MTRRVRATARLCKVIAVLACADGPLKTGQVLDALFVRYGIELVPSTVWRDLQTLADHGLAKRQRSSVTGWVLKLKKE